jgi:hydrogenase maturation protease
MKILIAGIGNVFHGDDAFGCEVVRQLEQCALPHGVTVTDFGIRSRSLAYALTDGYDATIIVNSAPCNRAPGTLYFIEPHPGKIQPCERAEMDTYSTNPIDAIQMAQALGGVRGKIYLVGCEPVVMDNDMSEIGLSLHVRQAIPQALAMVESLLANLVLDEEDTVSSLVVHA